MEPEQDSENDTSIITASYNFVMNKKYIEVKHESILNLLKKNQKETTILTMDL